MTYWSLRAYPASGDIAQNRPRCVFSPATGFLVVGLVVVVLLLTLHGWLASRAAQLRGWQLFFATSFAAALGLVMILLKDLVLTHLH